MHDLPSIDRRNAMRLFSAATLGAGLAMPAARARAATTSSTAVNLPAPSRSDYDVIVVGAGFAGVTAARELAHQGLSVLVLEARSRVGGRTFTSKFEGAQVELGGTWVHWTQPHVWSEITRYGMSLTESPGATADIMSWIAAGRHHTAKSEQILPRMAAMFDRYCDVDGQHGRGVMPMPNDDFANLAAALKWDKLSLQDRLNQMPISQADKDLISPLLTIDCHNDPRLGGFLVQLHWWALGDYDFNRMFDKLGRYKIEQGMSALSAAILNDSHADLLLGTPVESVSRQGARTVVKTQSGKSFTASAVVMAVPMNTLADISFQPALSQAKLDMSRQRHSSNGVKCYIHIRQKIGKWFGCAPFPHPIVMAWTEHESEEGTTIVAFGPPGSVDITDEEAVQKALRELLPKAEVTSVTGYQWGADPYSKGTWCWFRPGQTTQGLRAMQAPEGSIFLATGDIANGWRGFVDGAIESGLTATRNVRQYLNK